MYNLLVEILSTNYEITLIRKFVYSYKFVIR